MTTQEKLDAIKAIVVPIWNETKSFDKCCEACIGIDGIGFGDITALVKKTLVDEGLVIPVKVRQEKCAVDIEELDQLNTWADFGDMIESLSIEHDLTKAQVKRLMVAHYKTNEWVIPRENVLKGWKLQIVKCFTDNPLITIPELTVCITPHVKDESTARHYANYYHEFARQLVNIDSDV